MGTGTGVAHNRRKAWFEVAHERFNREDSSVKGDAMRKLLFMLAVIGGTVFAATSDANAQWGWRGYGYYPGYYSSYYGPGYYGGYGYASPYYGGYYAAPYYGGYGYGYPYGYGYAPGVSIGVGRTGLGIFW